MFYSPYPITQKLIIEDSFSVIGKVSLSEGKFIMPI